MNTGYFSRVMTETPTRLWINNPTGDEIDCAIAVGARNVTTNPAYCSRLIKSETDYITDVIDEAIKETSDDNLAADIVYQRVAGRIMDRFKEFHGSSGGKDGFVTIQADPREDESSDAIIETSLRHCKLGTNYMAKIPVTLAGTRAMEQLIRRGVPICATEVFSISQAIHMCELYTSTANHCGKRPAMYLTHITGIFDEYLQRLVKLKGIDIPADVLAQAGCAVARKQYRLLRERGYEATMLGGGARVIGHFTEFVGGDMHITINWSTAKELIDANSPVECRIDVETTSQVIDELRLKIPDFRKAYDEDGLAVEEFAGYGPVQLFRNNFIEGWYRLLAEITARRARTLAW